MVRRNLEARLEEVEMTRLATEPQSTVVEAERQKRGFIDSVKGLFKVTEFVIFLIVIVMIIVGSIINPRLVEIGNLKIMTRDVAILSIAAIGEGFAIITAGIDLSVGSMVGFGGVMVAYFMMVWKLPVFVSILLTLVLGFLVGRTHGFFVTKLKMHGFLITLVTMGVARGFILVITNAFPITGLPRSFTFFGQGYLFNIIPVPVIIFLIVAGLAYYLLRYTYIGRHIYASGGNIEAARFSGVNVDARVTLACRMSLGHPGSGEGYELQAIAACILGGLSFAGGEGSVIGIIVGAMLIGVLQNLMIMLNINPYWHKIVIYLVLLVAITFDYARRRRRR
jgi:ribose transport system permease protein